MSKSSGVKIEGNDGAADLKTLHKKSHNQAIAQKRMRAFIRSLARQSAESDFRAERKDQSSR